MLSNAYSYPEDRLAVAFTAIHSGEKFVPCHSIYDLLHIWHWFCIKFRHLVKFPEINAEPYRTVLFRYKNYRR